MGNVGVCGLVGELIAPGPANFLLIGDSTGGKKPHTTYPWAVGARGRGFWMDKKRPNAKPFYHPPFSIPKAYKKMTKDEIQQFVDIVGLTKIKSSEWAAPSFIIPKKNQTVRVITDFQGLNKQLKRTPYPMPKIP